MGTSSVVLAGPALIKEGLSMERPADCTWCLHAAGFPNLVVCCAHVHEGPCQFHVCTAEIVGVHALEA
ncbi:hypothetical protein GUITHDRAFT_164197 [Guillardia theta CCMP2712]|uniref:Uncharacterized protein n=1 Tax=Guillardia theta (strain CCMP2712) TaxID=905079 RepID=L1J2B5_GUITC|nr:hypothetical protein GUITHDRAFT_164197 [Guillardia theta CCMP2712]EKX42235.1 hypothetical protein GUITHDRAFT_164197 [Guillardia theta CCMP2712]|eukprot:XP_005829215.1 hypothetical protein GUITHDRAFT_164197 [Guillardia theta CCMP2712]